MQAGSTPTAPASPPTASGHATQETGAQNRPLNGSADLSFSSQQPQQPTRPKPQAHHTSEWSQRLKEQIQHEFDPTYHEPHDPPRDTVRRFSRKKQQFRLWRLSWSEWLMTLVFCLSYFAILYTYSKKKTISVRQRRIFNALTTGNALFLGVNLSASLRSYAKMLRWRMLASTYQPLEIFDLIMGCDSQQNVFKLLLKGRKRKSWYPLNTWTQFFCLVWLIVQLAASISVAIIGLTYNLNTSDAEVLTGQGVSLVTNFSQILDDGYSAGLNSVHNFGIKGANFDAVTCCDPTNEEATDAYETTSDGLAEYWFTDSSDANQDPVQDISDRFINATTVCDVFEVVEGQYGNLSYVVYIDAEGHQRNQSIYTPPGYQGIAFISEEKSTLCGPRCTPIHAFQAMADPLDLDADDDGVNITYATYFNCNTTVAQVYSLDNSSSDLPTVLSISDEIAQMIAGSIGFTGQSVGNTSFDAVAFSNVSGTVMPFASVPSPQNMSNAISNFAMGAVAAMDDYSNGLGTVTLKSDRTPMDAQVLAVQWWFTGSILIAIPTVHFVTLGLVIFMANKVVIRDDSHLAISKAYQTLLLERLGLHGCLMKGDEMIEYMENPYVKYAAAGAEVGDGVKHCDVVLKDKEGERKLLNSFLEGRYDGEGHTVKESDLQLRLPHQRVDASIYF